MGGMSMFIGPSSSDPSQSGLPRGEVLGSYPTYVEARRVVDELAAGEFDVRTVSIVGTDLRTVERIRNRLTYPSVALRSAIQGAFFGMMLGILMTLIDPAGTGFQILYTVGLGVAVWVIFGVIGHAMRKGRGVSSVQQLVPTNFDVVCEFETAARAREVLGRPAPPASGSPASGGPTKGSTSDPTTGPTSGPSTGAGQGPTPAEGPADTAPPRRGTLPDLPDGRPQFGVRLPEAAPHQAPDGDGAPARRTGRRADPDRPVDGVTPGSAAPGPGGDRPSSGPNDRT